MTCIGKSLAGLVLLLIMAAGVHAQGMPGDSVKSTLIINPRLHSAGYFPFTGAMLNRDPVFDVNIFFERKRYGFFVFQSVDLVDRKSYVNYLQPGIFATCWINPKVRIRTFFGYIFSQTDGFSDSTSDYYAAVQGSWTISDKVRIENTLLFYDLTLGTKLANRLLVSWAIGKFKADFYLWDRVVMGEKAHALSGSVGLTGPELKLSRKTSVLLTASYMGYITEHRPSFALGDGFLFTLAVPVNVLP